MRIKLKDLERGQTFYGAGIQWLVLGHTKSIPGMPIATHVISAGIVEYRAFDEQNRNNLGASTLLAYLNGKFLERLEAAFGERSVLGRFIDLTSTDGLKDYGSNMTRVGLLTEEEYRQNRDILPPLGGESWWWLATPYSTEQAGYPTLVRGVYSDGAVNHMTANSSRNNGVRPTLYLKSNLSVSLDKEDGVGQKDASELYAKAVEQFGKRSQILMAIEEMSELTKALLKYIRYEDFRQGDREALLADIAEERADAAIMLRQLEVIFGANEQAEREKLERLARLIEREKTEAAE